MSRTVSWLLGATVLALGLLAGYAQLVAQRPPDRDDPDRRPERPERPAMPFFGPIGRYVVAQTLPDRIILLDTMTGDLYEATPKDYKKLSDRPRMGRPGGEKGPPPRDDEKEPRKEKDKEKRRPERKDDEKPKDKD